MYSKIEKPEKSKSMAVSNSLAQKKINVKQAFGFVDDRSETIVQRRRQLMVNSGDENSSSGILQAVFLQNSPVNLQDSHHGGVHSQYDTANNLIELHIDAGANDDNNLMQDFLVALWEARDTITAGQVRAAGGIFMRPGGAQVLKMTMELLGESIGQGVQLTAARNAKNARKQANAPLTAGNDILDATIVPEHLAYRNSMNGVAGITMNPIGGGTTGGTVDMLPNTGAGQAEQALYDAAIIGLRPFMSLAININLAVINQVIAMMQGKVGFLKLLYLKSKYMKNG